MFDDIIRLHRRAYLRRAIIVTKGTGYDAQFSKLGLTANQTGIRRIIIRTLYELQILEPFDLPCVLIVSHTPLARWTKAWTTLVILLDLPYGWKYFLLANVVRFACPLPLNAILARGLEEVWTVVAMRPRSHTPVESTVLKDEDTIVEVAVSAEVVYPHREIYLYAHLV
ncbi:hypothetical protein JB92DRAFT_3139898 [Gautieria morchelliformis]|nr:hypothetical protein JB92DRAFT_3139898 [Gautieria morchelliformis]